MLDGITPQQKPESAEATEKKSKLPAITSLVVTAIGLIYLLLVLCGQVGKDRFGQTETTIFIAILLLNSNLIERLEKFQFSKDGVTVDLREQIAAVQGKQAEIQQLSQSNQHDIQQLVQFLVKNFLNKYEYSHLKKLASPEPFPFRKQRSFEEQLRRLRDLNLIGPVVGDRLSIGKLPSQGDDLKAFVRITDCGRECLSMLEQALIARDQQALVNNPTLMEPVNLSDQDFGNFSTPDAIHK
jgi:hypothetical protein